MYICEPSICLWDFWAQTHILMQPEGRSSTHSHVCVGNFFLCVWVKCLKFHVPWNCFWKNPAVPKKLGCLVVPVFGSLSHAHWLAVHGVCIGELHKTKAKQLAKICSISTIIGSIFIWKTMIPLPLNCNTHNGLLNCLHLLEYSENVIPDET